MKIFCAICFVICAVFSTAAQNSESLQTNESIAPEIVARSGWTVPFFIGSINVSPLQSLDLIEEVDIRARVNSFGQEKLLYFEECEAKGNLPAAGNKREGYLFDDFITYETKGKVFAYQFISRKRNLPQNLVNQPKSAKETPTGCQFRIEFLYVDEDGDGTFERRCGTLRLADVPQWVKDFGQLRVRTSAKN